MSSRQDKTRPRWQVQLWAFTMDVVTGFMAVVGAVFALCIACIWVWGAVDGPFWAKWPLRVGFTLVALAWIGRRVDRWSDERTRSAPQVQTPPTMRHPVYTPPREEDR